MNERRETRDALPRLRSPIPRLAVVILVAMVAGLAIQQWAVNESAQNDTAAQSARDVLDIAAKAADADAAGSGRFWRVRILRLTAATPQPATGYRLQAEVVTESWTSPDSSESDWEGHRQLAVRPATPADEAAWKRDGAPSTGSIEGVLAKRDPQSHVAQDFTARQLRNLPTNPASLRAELAQTPIDRDPTPAMESILFNRTALLLSDTPVSPQVRGAALRLLAGLSGVRSTGPVTDALGRKGIGVTFVTAGTVAETRQLVIDPANGRLLGSVYPGSHSDQVLRQGHSVLLAAEWTNQDPTVPSAEIR